MNTKRMALVGLLAAISAININTASAEENGKTFFKPYVGFEGSMLKADYQVSGGIDYSQVFDDSFKGFSPFVGAQVHEHIALELGYLQTDSAKKSEDASAVLGTPGATASTELKLKGWYADVIGNYPVQEKFNLLGSVGLARLKADAKATVTAGSLSAEVTDDESDTALRFGLGVEYAFTDSLSARGMIRYMKVDFDDTADNLMQYGIGLKYRF